MRENRTHGSEGGDGESRFRPLLRSVFSFWGGEHKIMEYLVVNVNSPKKRGKHHVPVV